MVTRSAVLEYTLSVVRVLTHPLPSPKRAACVVREVVRLYGERRPVVVWVVADNLRAALDDYLWNFEKLAFLPHVVWTSDMGGVDDPVVLVGEPANPNHAEVLVVGDEPPPEGWATEFDEVHDFIAPGEEGVTREAWWRKWRETHAQREGE